MNQPVNTILSNQQLQVALHNHDLLERLRALRGSGGGSGGVNWDNTIIVQLEMGQSNNVAQGEAARLGLTKYPLMPVNTRIYRKTTLNETNNGSLANMVAGVNEDHLPSPAPGGTIFGGYNTTSELLSSHLGGYPPIYVLHASRGGTTMQYGLTAAPSWDPTVQNEMFNYAMNGVFTHGLAAIQAENPGKDIQVVIKWHQSEADNTDNTATTNYPANFNAFRAAVRAFHPLLANAPWIITLVNYNLTANETTINNFFTSLVDSRTKVVDISSQPRKMDLTVDQKGGFAPSVADDKHNSYLQQNLKGEQEYAHIVSILNIPGSSAEYTTNTAFDPATINAGHIRLQGSRGKVTINTTTNQVTSPVNDLSTGSFSVVTGKIRFKVSQRHGWFGTNTYDYVNASGVNTVGVIESSVPIGTTLFSHSFSVSKWVYPYNGNLLQFLIQDIDNTTTPTSRFALFITALGEVQVQYQVPSFAVTQAKTPVIFAAVPNKPVHISVTLTSGDKIRIYINGILQVLTTVSGTGENISTANMAGYANAVNKLQIGRRLVSAVTGDYYVGLWRELTIQPVVYSDGDIANLMLN